MSPRLLLLGGVDPSGGAGLSVDAVVAALHGCAVAPVVTALTVQNRHAFSDRVAPDAAFVARACAAAFDDGPVAAIKVGMLGAPTLAATVATALRPLAGTVPIVVDPVLVSTAPGLAAGAPLVAAYREHLLPLATVLLPNGPERAAFGDLDGCAGVLAKDGHGDGESCRDELRLRGAVVASFARPRLPVGRVRGTGCALATAIAARLAHGAGLADACRDAGDWLFTLLQHLGPGRGDAPPRLLPLATAERVRCG